MHLYRCGLVFGPAEARARDFARITGLSSGLNLERGSIERRGFDREARGNKARRALEGERYRGALHDCG